MLVNLSVLLMNDLGHLIDFLLQLAVLGINPNNHLLIGYILTVVLSVMSDSKFYFVMISEFYLDSINLLVISSVLVFF